MGKASGVGLAAALLGFSAACGTTVSEAPPAQVAVASAHAPVAAPPPVAVARAVAVREGAMIALGLVDGRRVLYVGDEDEHLVRVVDVEREEELSTTPLDGRPGQLLVREDGKLLVAMRDRARVVVLAPSGGLHDPLVAVAHVAVAPEPIGLALTPEDDTLVVASGWGRAVTVIDARSMIVQAAHPIAREARSVVVSDDSHRALVSHAAGGTLTVVDLVGDTRVRETVHQGTERSFSADGDAMAQLGGRTPMQGYALAKTKGPLGGRVLMPQVLVFPGDPTTASEGYGGSGERLGPELFNVAVVDDRIMQPLRASLELQPDAELDDTRKPVPQRRCLLPRAAVTRDRELFVACLGIDSVVAYDAASVRPRTAERRRFRVAEGPTGLAIDEHANVLWVWSQFARSLTRIELGAPGDTVRSFALVHHAPAAVDDPEVALGRRLFHAVGDARIARDGRACASCHPDGRDDGLVWSTPNGPRQTPMLAGRTVGTAPYSWQGDTHTVVDHLEHTLARLEGKGLPREERDAIAKYLAAMPTPPPLEVSTGEARLAARGAALFASPEVGCASCHGARGDDPDGLPHDVKSRAQGDKAKAFDTPSLKFLAGSAPYFHDGRYATLRELLRATDGAMGHTKHLSDDDKDALEAFLETL